VQCDGRRVDAIPAGHVYRHRPQLVWYRLLAAAILPPVLKAGAGFIEIENID
jgi:hypothetical protein